MDDGQRAEAAAAALAVISPRFAAAVPGGWSKQAGGVVAVFTGAPVASLNVVFCARRDATAEAVTALVDEVAAGGVPYAVETRTPAGEAAARARGLVEGGLIPFMVLDDPAPLAAAVGDVPIRRLGPDELDLHVDVMAEGFEAPAAMVDPMRAGDLLEQPGNVAYVAEVDGEPVATALGMTGGGHVGIFNVATPARHRRRGYGAALTARVVLDAFADGATAAFLQSSDLGYPVYERLGFRTLETWTLWTPGTP